MLGKLVVVVLCAGNFARFLATLIFEFLQISAKQRVSFHQCNALRFEFAELSQGSLRFATHLHVKFFMLFYQLVVFASLGTDLFGKCGGICFEIAMCSIYD